MAILVDFINYKVILLILSTTLLAMTSPVPTQSTAQQVTPNHSQRTFASVAKSLFPQILILPTVALLLSAVMTWANVGFGDAFLPRWGKSFLTSLVVLPIILVSLGALEKWVDTTFTTAHWVARKLAVSLLTAFAIESVLALVVTALSTPWGHSFAPTWWITFSRSMPVGVVIGLFMAFYLKPKMDQMKKAVLAAQV
jgi:hypothetical protein